MLTQKKAILTQIEKLLRRILTVRRQIIASGSVLSKAAATLHINVRCYCAFE